MIRRKKGWHPGEEIKHRAPAVLTGTGREGGPAGFWPAKSWDSLLPEPIARRKSPGDGKHQTLATVMYKSNTSYSQFGLGVGLFPGFGSFFVLSAPFRAAAAVPGTISKGSPPSPSPRQRQPPARTCPEVSGVGKDAGSIHPGGADPAGGEEPSEEAPCRDVPRCKKGLLELKNR